MATKLNIPSALISTEQGGFVADATMVFDETQNKRQSVINAELYSAISGGSGGGNDVIVLSLQSLDLTDTSVSQSQITSLMNLLSSEGFVYNGENHGKGLVLIDSSGHFAYCDYRFSSGSSTPSNIYYSIGGYDYVLSSSSIHRLSHATQIYQGTGGYGPLSEVALGTGLEYNYNTGTINVTASNAVMYIDLSSSTYGFYGSLTDTTVPGGNSVSQLLTNLDSNIGPIMNGSPGTRKLVVLQDRSRNTVFLDKMDPPAQSGAPAAAIYYSFKGRDYCLSLANGITDVTAGADLEWE